jgi:restriction modification system DNA specificity domain protein
MNTKQTEIDEIPEDWEVVKLGEILTPSNERINPLYQFSDFCIELEHIQSNLGMLSGSTQTNKYSSLKNIFKKDDVLFGKLRAYLKKFWFARKDGVCSTEIWVLKTNLKKAVPNFSYYIVQSDNFIEAASESYGTRMPRSEWKTVKELTIPLPPLPEQAAIAAVLSDTDRLLTTLRALIGKKRAVKTAAMQQLLSGRLRLPGFAATGRLKNSELGEIPEDWEVVKLGEIANIQRGASPRPIDSPIWFDQSSSIGWLRISDVSNADKYLYETSQNLSELGVANSRLIEQDNLVMSICATVGKPIITKKDLCIHDGFVVFGSLHCDMEFMYYILQSIEPIWAKSGQTGSQMNLNTDLIKSTQVALPQSKPEQTAIAQTLSDMDSEIAALEARAAKLAQIKQGLMQNLLTGKIRVNTGAA